jgi:hypothetical protein
VAGTAWNNNSDESAVLWVNGAATLLPMPSGLTGEYYASGIAVSGSDVYTVGTVVDSGETAAYWVNGGAATLLPMSSGTSESYATAIAVATQ